MDNNEKENLQELSNLWDFHLKVGSFYLLNKNRCTEYSEKEHETNIDEIAIPRRC